MSKTGAIDRPSEDRPPRTTLIPPPRPSVAADVVSPAAQDPRLDAFFIPDFCATRMVFAVVLIAELVALTLALARPDAPFLTELARISLFLQWLGLTNAALLCYSRRWLAKLTVPRSSVAAFALIILNTVVISEFALWLGTAFGAVGVTPLPADHWSFLLRNAGIALIVTALLLRYFFVTHQWQKHVRAEALSRIQALQARIRPHFLFNSMNTIASLTRSNPRLAEQAVEDLADLLRANLGGPKDRSTLRDELEIATIYQRIEQLRLGDRLSIRWDLEEIPLHALLPNLTLQPLIENAIYHGVELVPDGGEVVVTGRQRDGRVVIEISNPFAPAAKAVREGNKMALSNIRQRFELKYGAQGQVIVRETDTSFAVRLEFPLEEDRP